MGSYLSDPITAAVRPKDVRRTMIRHGRADTLHSLSDYGFAISN